VLASRSCPITTPPPAGERLHVRVELLAHLYDGDALPPIGCRQENTHTYRVSTGRVAVAVARAAARRSRPADEVLPVSDKLHAREREELLHQMSVSACSPTRGPGCCVVGGRSARHPPRAIVRTPDGYITGTELLIEPLVEEEVL
jgi:hypothetical protein